jgi:hypothetical protein
MDPTFFVVPPTLLKATEKSKAISFLQVWSLRIRALETTLEKFADISCCPMPSTAWISNGGRDGCCQHFVPRATIAKRAVAQLLE